MEKLIKFTAEMIIDDTTYDDGWMPKTFEDAVECDYDNIERPMEHLIDAGWKITNKRMINYPDKVIIKDKLVIE